MSVDEKLQQTAELSAGDTATLEIESTNDWPEPHVPQDFDTALRGAPQKIQDLMGKDYADGALGMGSLDKCNSKP